MERESMVFYRSFYDAVKALDPEDFKECVVALLEYALNGNETGTSGISAMFLSMAKPQVDANNRRYENGKRGGKKSNQTVTKPNQTETKSEPNCNQTVTKPVPNLTKPVPNVNVNVNANVNANDNAKRLEAIPLDDGTEWVASDADISELKRLYPKLDLENEFRKMRAWSLSNPTKRKTARGIKRFVNSWLSHTSEKPQEKPMRKVQSVPDYMLESFDEQPKEKVKRW